MDRPHHMGWEWEPIQIYAQNKLETRDFEGGTEIGS